MTDHLKDHVARVAAKLRTLGATPGAIRKELLLRAATHDRMAATELSDRLAAVDRKLAGLYREAAQQIEAAA